jgi:hypothetical protein
MSDEGDHYYCDEGTDEDPTPIHRCGQNAGRHSPNYMYREDEEPIAYQIFCGEESEIIHERCAKAPEDREFPLYTDDIEAARNLEPIQCFMCGERIAEAKVTP